MSAYNHDSLIDAEVTREAKAEQGNWFLACCGLEASFISRSGKKMLYVYQPATGKHAYLDVNADIIMTDEEARAALQLY